MKGLPPDAAASMKGLPRAVLGLILTLAFYCGYAGQATGAETAGTPVAERSLYIEPPEDHSGKSLATDVLGSLHEGAGVRTWKVTRGLGEAGCPGIGSC